MSVSRAKTSVEEIARQRGMYHADAYYFVQEGLAATSQKVHPDRAPGKGRHVTGQQLSEGLRDVALERWGGMALAVLARWNVHETRDFGHIVFGSDHILFDIRSNLMPDGSETDTIGHIVRMDLLDVNDVQPQGMEVLPYRTNIFHGNDPSRWGTDLLTCKQIIFEDLWDGIDLVYGSDNGRIKYEYRVGPGANHEKISFSFSGL